MRKDLKKAFEKYLNVAATLRSCLNIQENQKRDVTFNILTNSDGSFTKTKEEIGPAFAIYLHQQGIKVSTIVEKLESNQEIESKIEAFKKELKNIDQEIICFKIVEKMC